MTNLSIAYILIVLGFVFLLLEVFLTTGGLLIVLAVVCDLVGVVMVFYFGDSFRGFITLAVVTLTMPLFAGFMFYIWPRTPMGRRLMLRRQKAAEDTIAAMPELSDLERMRGRIGKAVSPLRPSGVVEFDGKRIDSISEGFFVDADTWVKCIDVRAGKVLVRPIDEPRLSDLENADFT
jgi:membrane-bound serine protease (ClpP class)